MIVLTLIIIGVVAKRFRSKNEIDKNTSYAVIHQHPEFEIRHYPHLVLATISLPGRFLTNAKKGLNHLYDYIKGYNRKKRNIQSTHNLHIEDKLESADISLVIPQYLDPNLIPQPCHPEIRISKMKSAYYAVIKFKGMPTNEDIKRQIKQLRNVLKRQGIKCYGNIRYIAYQAKWRFFAKKNEVLIPVEWETTNSPRQL